MDVKWIKLSTDLFNNRKIKQIRKLPEGDAIIGTWLQILCLAGNINNGGLVYFSNDIPYTDEMLANEFDRPLNIIRLSLDVFKKFEMIDLTDKVICVSNWEKYQSQDKLEALREYNREKKREQRLKQKEKELSLTSPRSQDTDIISISKSNSISKDLKENKKNSFKDLILSYTTNKSLQESLKGFADMRKTIKKPLTDLAFKKILNKLDQLADNDTDKIKILDNSIMNSWQGIFELKEEKKKPKSANPFDDLLREELRNEQNRNNSFNEGNQRFLPDVLQE